jgi:hypothetical protein
MTEGRFYSLLMCIFAVVVVGLLLLFNWAQKPEGLDRQLVTTILTFLGPFGLVLLNNMANSKQVQELKKGQAEIKEQLPPSPKGPPQ